MPQSVILSIILLLNVLGISLASFCTKRRFYRIAGIPINAAHHCEEYYQWTVNDLCCYDRSDTRADNPYCCQSETYKLLVAVGIICAMVVSVAFCVFLCWCYNLPHLLLRLITCGKFSLNDYLKKAKLAGPYVDPSFYSGDPFWTSEGSEFSHYPLRPMPPRIFYPVPAKVDMRRWSNNNRQLSNGQTPLFVLASRQFTRNPYSARPNERGSASSSISGPEGINSRRSSSSSCAHFDAHRQSSFGFKVHIDEVDAASELLEALKNLDDKDKTFIIPKVKEETQRELDLENEIQQSDPDPNRTCRGSINRNESELVPTKDSPAVHVRPIVVPTHVVNTSHPPPTQQILDVTKLHRAESGTLSSRRHPIRGSSIDSLCSTFTLESISEERAARVSAQQRLSNGPRSATIAEPGTYPNSFLPGYIPEEIEPDMKEKARKSLCTA